MAIKSFGASMTVATNAIGGLTSITESGGDTEFIDVTNHATTNDTREFISGLTDPGTIEISGDYSESDTGQAYLVDNEGASAAVVVTYSDGTTMSCTAIVGHYSVPDVPLEGKVQFTCTLKVSGPKTRAAAA